MALAIDPGTLEGSTSGKDAASSPCGCRGGDLNAHHLDCWSEYPDSRFDPDNGITLCSQCHAKFHSWLGGTHVPCTADDYLDWVAQ
jgi:hypothetical protein